MSSDYRILCLSHNPAIVIDGDWHSSRDGHIAAIAAAANPAGHEATRHHAHCDLLVGRYSYPLVEVACPPCRSGETKHVGFHRDAIWIDANWLRLLAAAYASKDDAVLRAAQDMVDCWTADRVNRLRYELRTVNDEGMVDCPGCGPSLQPACRATTEGCVYERKEVP